MIIERRRLTVLRWALGQMAMLRIVVGQLATSRLVPQGLPRPVVPHRVQYGCGFSLVQKSFPPLEGEMHKDIYGAVDWEQEKKEYGLEDFH